MNTTGIWSEKDRVGGCPCIRGHRFSLAQLLAEVASGRPLREISEDFYINYDGIRVAWTDLVNELHLLNINSEYIMSDGENCLRDTGLPISLILMSLLVENRTPKEAGYYYDLEQKQIEGLLWNLASLLDRDWTKGPPDNISQAIKEGPT